MWFLSGSDGIQKGIWCWQVLRTKVSGCGMLTEVPILIHLQDMKQVLPVVILPLMVSNYSLSWNFFF